MNDFKGSYIKRAIKKTTISARTGMAVCQKNIMAGSVGTASCEYLRPIRKAMPNNSIAHPASRTRLSCFVMNAYRKISASTESTITRLTIYTFRAGGRIIIEISAGPFLGVTSSMNRIYHDHAAVTQTSADAMPRVSIVMEERKTDLLLDVVIGFFFCSNQKV